MRNREAWAALAGLAALCGAPAIAQQRVAPTSRVTSAVVVREDATTQSAALERLRPGEALELRGEVPDWYEVLLPDGSSGFVSKAWTELVQEAGAPGEPVWKVHFVDVGTGLATFVEGPDFALVFDGGSNDDRALGPGNRFLAYIRKASPDLSAIDHMIVSHPHRDHVELLPDLFDAYAVRNLWESGRAHDICGYRALVAKVVAEPGIVYHDAHGPGGEHRVRFAPKRCYGTPPAALDARLIHGSALTRGLTVALGANASMTFLTADPSAHPDPNENSVVVRLDLGLRRLLFTGDAEASPTRELPSVAPRPDFAEGVLTTCCARDLKSDLLVAAHHGSMSSSRQLFLDAVGAQDYVISSGPQRYGSVTLPDAAVVSELAGRGRVWRTDVDDAGCRNDTAKIGPDNDSRAGGCDNILVRITRGGALFVSYERIDD